MENDVLKKLVTDAVNQGINESWWKSFLPFLVVVTASTFGGYILAYVKKRAENRAATADFPALIAQLKASTQAAEQIKNEISQARELFLERLGIVHELYKHFTKVLLAFAGRERSSLDALAEAMNAYNEFFEESRINIGAPLYSQIAPLNNQLAEVITNIRANVPETTYVEGFWWFVGWPDQEAQKREVDRLKREQELYEKGRDICAKIRPLLEEYHGTLIPSPQNAA